MRGRRDLPIARVLPSTCVSVAMTIMSPHTLDLCVCVFFFREQGYLFARVFVSNLNAHDRTAPEWRKHAHTQTHLDTCADAPRTFGVRSIRLCK